MKKIIIILLIAGAIVWSMDNKEQVDEYSRKTKRWLDQTILGEKASINDADPETDIPDSNDKPGLTSSDKPPGSVPSFASGNRLEDTSLPDGIYFTKERISLVTETGIKAIAKGVRVEKIGESEGNFLISDGKVQISSAPHLLTRNSSEIAKLLEQTVKAGTSKPKPGGNPSATNSAAPKPKTPHPELSATKDKLRVIEDRIYQLEYELHDLRSQQTLAKMRGRVSSKHVDIEKVQNQLNLVLAERARVARRLAEID
ncbi:hypothetical protein FEM03_20200 [Phragmitibacter flavus]|uniref:Uncharacterized protein n=1 Tax=Phragmitibacter flavus TaxID=2576071 RepID=A0A5R8KAP4_9BACT|nr:hypothetical protein [Phragmitibacter flavus]TLD68985.1 hypothetical protein FEM03_20200 [Phragmitibacter flavus]